MGSETGATDPLRELQERLNFLGLDEAARDALRSIKPIVDREIPIALDKFYERVQANPGDAGAFHQPRAHRQRQGASGRALAPPVGRRVRGRHGRERAPGGRDPRAHRPAAQMVRGRLRRHRRTPDRAPRSRRCGPRACVPGASGKGARPARRSARWCASFCSISNSPPPPISTRSTSAATPPNSSPRRVAAETQQAVEAVRAAVARLAAKKSRHIHRRRPAGRPMRRWRPTSTPRSAACARP